MPVSNKLRGWLAGADGPGRTALPAGELLHPIPLVAVGLLLLNDHHLKGSGLIPPLVTGKLSDFAGLLFFPLLLTALWDSLGLAAARLGARLDFSLRPWKLAAAVAVTGALFAAIKLSPAAASLVTAGLALVGFQAQIVSDPTDLVALVSLGGAWALGRRELARVPLGRYAVLARAHAAGRLADPRPALDDVVRAGADPTAVDALAGALTEHFGRPNNGGAAEAVERCLARLRGA